MNTINNCLNAASTRTIDRILIYGFIVRLVTVIYSILHDEFIDHIKYTDVDYHVYSNGSQSVVQGNSPYLDDMFRYSPIIAFMFVPNIILFESFGKLLLITLDIICGFFLFIINIHQGNNRCNSKKCLLLWLFNPVTIAISTRGSFEPVIALLVLATVYSLFFGYHTIAGIFYGLSIHLKLYPVIYAISLYLFMNQVKKRTQTKSQSKIKHIISAFCHPNQNQIKFFTTAVIVFSATTYLFFFIYGFRYIEQSFIYHINRKDLQHNFSPYFLLYHLFKEYNDIISKIAFIPQSISILYIAINFDPSLEANPGMRLKLLTFSMFAETFMFVSLNKVCTSQYFCWYLVFLPTILLSVSINTKKAISLITYWFAIQALWLLSAYLYEYHNLDLAFNLTGITSFVFLVSNLYIYIVLSKNLTLNPTKQ